MVDVAPSARKHGVEDEAMRHAVRNAIAVIDNDGITIFVGADPRTGALLEVGVLDTEEGPLIVHAMRVRAKYLRR